MLSRVSYLPLRMDLLQYLPRELSMPLAMVMRRLSRAGNSSMAMIVTEYPCGRRCHQCPGLVDTRVIFMPWWTSETPWTLPGLSLPHGAETKVHEYMTTPAM